MHGTIDPITPSGRMVQKWNTKLPDMDEISLCLTEILPSQLKYNTMKHCVEHQKTRAKKFLRQDL